MRIWKVTLRGRTRSIKKWADHIGVPYARFASRYYRFRKEGLEPRDAVAAVIKFYGEQLP